MVTTVVRGLMITAFMRLAFALSAACMAAMLLCGCIIVPLPSETQALPNITPFLPNEIRNSDTEVMAVFLGQRLAPRLGDTDYRFTVSKPFFLKASELDSVVRKFDYVRTEKIFWAVSGGLSNVERQVVKVTHALCAVTVDGLQIKFVPVRDEWTSVSLVPLHASRRDALVLALRASSGDPFRNIDGPCGLIGTADWPADLRLRAVEYLARIPPIEPSEGNNRLGQFLTRIRAEQQTPDRVTAILFARAKWRDQDVSSAPLFLRSPAFEEFKNLSAELKDNDNLSFFSTLYLSGAYDSDNLDLETVCAIDDRGGILYWSKEMKRWSQSDHVPPSEDWIVDAMRTLEGKNLLGRFGRFEDNCLPAQPNWSEAELQRVKAFVNAIPIK